MSYYKALGLDKEPFSTSPDPNFFYHSTSHITALKRLEIAIRLRRGLSLIVGDVGMGKTTLWRALVQEFKDEPEFIFHVMLDPGFEKESLFLRHLSKITGETLISGDDEGALRDALQKYLFQKGVEENGTVVLIIDEGQKLSRQSLEVLRTLLNYETNEYKLLQLVIMAQPEIVASIAPLENFVDRIALKYTLNPLDEEETRNMIGFRLRQAGYSRRFGLFTDEAIRLIHAKTGGYPRKIALLCHEALKYAIMSGADAIDDDAIIATTTYSFDHGAR